MAEQQVLGFFEVGAGEGHFDAGADLAAWRHDGQEARTGEVGFELRLGLGGPGGQQTGDARKQESQGTANSEDGAKVHRHRGTLPEKAGFLKSILSAGRGGGGNRRHKAGYSSAGGASVAGGAADYLTLAS
jgi:hypothetical protein